MPENASEPVPDSVLLASVDVARTALLEITPATTIGPVVGHVVEAEHVLSLLFDCTLPGYPGWHWTVTISRIDDESAPSVLETELMPGERALLAPDWVPWSERLADYQAAQELVRAEEAEANGDHDDDDGADDDDDDVDTDDDDTDSDELDVDIDVDDELDVDIEVDDVLDDIIDDADLEELSAADSEVDEGDEPDGDTDDRAPEPPDEIVGNEFAEEDQQPDEADDPTG